MNKHWQRGKLGLLGVSAAAIAAAAVPEDVQRTDSPSASRQAAVDRAASRAMAKRPAKSEPARLDLSPLKRSKMTAAPQAETPEDSAAAATEEPGEATNAFASTSWYVPPPPPPPAQAEAPAKPTAPPLPFNFMGMYQEPDAPRVAMLVQGDRLHTVSVGDTIDGVYRVESIAPGGVEFTYLPLQEKQSLSTGGAG